jgi:two-component system KDP operon response regulator KdpE
MTRILVVEDDAPLRDALATSLRAHGYDASEAGTAEEAVALASHDLPDLVLLDLSLPGADGFHALERLRTFTDIPVVVLTVRDAKDDKVRALDGGADDYVVKPFDLDELLARLRAALRRRPEGETVVATLVIGDLEIDRARGQVTRAGEPVHLTPTELRLLDLLVNSDGRLLTYGQVAAQLRTQRKEIDQGTLRVFVAQLRKKLGDDAADPRLIVTHHGLGYRWIAGDYEATDAAEPAEPA